MEISRANYGQFIHGAAWIWPCHSVGKKSIHIHPWMQEIVDDSGHFSLIQAFGKTSTSDTATMYLTSPKCTELLSEAEDSLLLEIPCGSRIDNHKS